MTEEAFQNALTMDMALGCSTNSMLHLPAIANECGIRLNVEIANEISEKTGFSNSSYFHKQFKKTTGLTPQQFRAQYGR